MGYGIAVDGAEEVELYRFGRSKQIFRGPRPDLDRPYVAFIGGSEPFGKFVSSPFPKLTQRMVDTPCVNWGTPGAGPGFFLKDPVLLNACSNAQICVIQVMDAVPLSNRLYSVFPRRNMRLRGVSDSLCALYPETDFGKFKYVPAMIRELKSKDPSAYKIVLQEQRSSWMARMLELMEDIETTKVLLWLAPDNTSDEDATITLDMVNAVSKRVDKLIKVSVAEKRSGNMLFGGGVKDTCWMTREVHEQVASVISGHLNVMLQLEHRSQV